MRVSLCLVTVLGVIWGGGLSGAAEFREWTASDGRKVLAEFVRVEGGKVTIKRRHDGRQFTLALEQLSQKDRDWVEGHGDTAVAAAGRGVTVNAPEHPMAALLSGAWERSESKGLEYRLFGERELLRGGSGESGKVPLVVCLHGRTGDVMTPEQPWPANAFAQSNRLRERPCIVFAPQAPKDNETWSGKNGKAVVGIVEDLVKHLPIDEKRIYIVGYSMGAYGTFHLLAQEPKLFAAAVPVAGGGNPSKVRAHRKVPVWVFHGEKDDVVEVEQSQRMVDAMKKARAPVKFSRDPEGDHGIGGQVFNDGEMHEWLFQQKRS